MCPLHNNFARVLNREWHTHVFVRPARSFHFQRRVLSALQMNTMQLFVMFFYHEFKFKIDKSYLLTDLRSFGTSLINGLQLGDLRTVYPTGFKTIIRVNK